MIHTVVYFFLLFRATYLLTFHSSPVLRILLYLECLPFLQSLHHLFVLDFSAVCGYWPNKNTAFISPGGPFTEQIAADTNISTLYPYPPAAVSYIQSHTQQASLALFSLQPAGYYMGAAPVVEATGDTCLLFSARLGRPPRVDPRVNYFQSSWDLYHSHTGASGTTAPQGGGFPFYVSMGRDCHPSSRRHRSIWPAACIWTLSRIGFFITHTKWLCQGLY